MAKFTDEERKELILKIADYIITNKSSTRKTAKIFGISNFSISDYMNDKLMLLDVEKHKKVQEILNNNKPKTIEDESVKTRILEEAKLINSGMTATEVANSFGISIDVIHDDLTSRLPKIDKELAVCISAKLKLNSTNNLQHKK